MPGLSPALIRDNPWWTDPAAIDRDPDLLRLARSEVRLELPLPFRFDLDAVYTLRGPRQVGKSTLLKRLIADLLRHQGRSPRSVLYLDVEGAGIGTVLRLRNALTAYLTWARTQVPDSRYTLLLDEITGVRDWGAVVRALYREGSLAGVTVIATGSHALDVARGGESAPGRRGERYVDHPDWILMPAGFRDFLAAHDSALVSALPAIDLMDPKSAHAAAQEIILRGDLVRALFDRYVMTGGYPHAMSAEQGTGRIEPGVYQLYRAAIMGQMRRAGHGEGPFREVVNWAAGGRLGREFSWNAVAAETDVGTKETAHRYIEDAERLFLWHVLHRAQSEAVVRPALKSPKKLYPTDPFAWHVLASWAAGDADPWAASLARLADPAFRGELIEGVVGDHLIRGFAPFAFYHRAPQGAEEIDFVLHREHRRARVEVKYRTRIRQPDVNRLAKYDGGILATVDELAYDAGANVARVPVYALLAGYTEPITLFPARW